MNGEGGERPGRALILPIEDGEVAAKPAEGLRESAETASMRLPTGAPVGPRPGSAPAYSAGGCAAAIRAATSSNAFFSARVHFTLLQ